MINWVVSFLFMSMSILIRNEIDYFFFFECLKIIVFIVYIFVMLYILMGYYDGIVLFFGKYYFMNWERCYGKSF